jgi:hypothetical protein
MTAEIPDVGPIADAPAERTMRVYVTNAIRTSRGTGPGWLELPVHEGNALLGARMASYRSPDDMLAAEIRSSSALMAPRRPG